MKRRILSFFLMFTLMLPLSSLTAETLDVSYTPSEPYKSSGYYKNLLGVTLTGDQAKDIVAVAASQVGNHEGNKFSELDGSNKSGTDNYSEYGYWFGTKVKGNTYGHFYAWCAMFVLDASPDGTRGLDIHTGHAGTFRKLVVVGYDP